MFVYFLKQKIMSIVINLTAEEILSRPNDFELGEFVRNRYWQERRNQEGPPSDDEHFFLNIDEDGSVKSIGKPWVCSICGEKTDKVDYDYLAGWDHLGCRLKAEMSDEKDKCVICGKESPYSRNTHIDLRIGYVEGGGQGCFQPNNCDKI